MDNKRRHHTLFTRATWDSQESTRLLRRLPQLIIPMHDEEHKALHDSIVTVPLLDHRTARNVYNEFQPVQGNIIGSLNILMRVIHEESRGRVERELGAVVIHALELQIPFIREGI